MWKRYKRQPLSNPYFPKQDKKSSGAKTTVGMLIGLIIVLGGLFLSPLFAIAEIRIEGLTLLSENAVRGALRESLSVWQRLPFLRAQTLKQELEKRFTFDAIEIRKEFPRTLVVTIKEREPFAVWQTGGQFFLIDKNGRLIHEVTPDERTLFTLPSLEDESQAPLEGTLVFPPSRGRALLETLLTLRDTHRIEVAAVRFPTRSSPWVKYVTTEGWELLIDLDGDTRQELEKMSAVLDRVGALRRALEYIDVRFADRVYYQ